MPGIVGNGKIIEANVYPSNDRYGDLHMVVKTEDGYEGAVFAWFSDELKFEPSDVIGLTWEDAQDLKQKRDIAYLQS